MVVALAVPAGAQAPASNLGLPAAGAIGVFAGAARLERSSDGLEGGAILDLGWFRRRTLRLQAEISFLRATLTEFIEVEDSTYSGRYFDLSAGMSMAWMPDPDGRASPFLVAGAAVHALSSTFGTLALDQRYNTNRFGSHVGAGLRWRATAGTAFSLEARRVIADETDRTVVRVTGLLLLGDLAGRR